MTILTYHRIMPEDMQQKKNNLCVTPEAFKNQMLYLINKGFSIVSLDKYKEALIADKNMKKIVSVTFDDGTTDLYDYALPVIEQLKIPVVFFISTNPLEGKNLESPTDPEKEKYVIPEQVREMHERGIIIASHGRSHIRLARCQIERARDEIFTSKSILENIIGEKVSWFCYPFGSLNHEVMKAVKEAGYTGGCSVIRDNRNSPEQIYFLNRVMIMNDTSMFRFNYFFSGIYHLLHKRKNKARWGKLLGNL